MLAGFAAFQQATPSLQLFQDGIRLMMYAAQSFLCYTPKLPVGDVR